MTLRKQLGSVTGSRLSIQHGAGVYSTPMQRTGLLMSSFCLFTLLPGLALADEAEPSALESPGAAEAESGFSYRLVGYLRVEGIIVEDDPDVAFVGHSDGFRLQNARLGVDATWRDLVDMRISAEGARDERANPNDIGGTLRFVLKDAYADVHAVAGIVDIRVARFLVIMDLEELIAPNDRGFIDRALESRGVAATEGWETEGLGIHRNIGVAVRGARALDLGDFALGYELAAQNGNDEFDSANDNDSLAYSGTLMASFRDSFLFAGARLNDRTVGQLPLRQDEEDLELATGLLVRAGPVRVAGQVLYRKREFPTTGGPTETAWGAHGELLGEIPLPAATGLQLGYRYAILEPSDLIVADQLQEHTFGVNYGPDAHWRVQLGYTITVEEEGRELDNDRLQALFEVTL